MSSLSNYRSIIGITELDYSMNSLPVQTGITLNKYHSTGILTITWASIISAHYISSLSARYMIISQDFPLFGQMVIIPFSISNTTINWSTRPVTAVNSMPALSSITNGRDNTFLVEFVMDDTSSLGYYTFDFLLSCTFPTITTAQISLTYIVPDSNGDGNYDNYD